MKQEILRFENVTCKKDGAVYLDNFSFYMTAGEIVGLLSVNDRGIKELIELMAKNHPIDAGRVYMGGKILNQEETSNRIYQIDQKSSLINDLSITDNLFVMRPGFKKQVINEWVLREQADRVLKQLSMDLDLNKRVERLTTMERIMVETDAPYMAPTPFRGKRCDSRYVYRMAETIAEIKGLTPAEVEQATTENGKALFAIP